MHSSAHTLEASYRNRWVIAKCSWVASVILNVVSEQMHCFECNTRHDNTERCIDMYPICSVVAESARGTPLQRDGKLHGDSLGAKLSLVYECGLVECGLVWPLAQETQKISTCTLPANSKPRVGCEICGKRSLVNVRRRSFASHSDVALQTNLPSSDYRCYRTFSLIVLWQPTVPSSDLARSADTGSWR